MVIRFSDQTVACIESSVRRGRLRWGIMRECTAVMQHVRTIEGLLCRSSFSTACETLL